ncbi:MAG: hypothetical protein P1U38_09525 [Aeromicrobium sp.]|uniref:hypothetical protein n=1 Tax=Aeromicrobium sp. TaxID=1871063 RepID=UPI00262B6E47|nr:hypothetical protein [Aeromicrobium sp.]MDF1705000.1 hypothetical protein [Aeromicrobium sp.]
MSDYTDAVSPRWRTRIYFAGLAVAALVLLVSAVAPIWFAPDVADKITQTATAAGTVAAFVMAGLGVAYRPTR